MDAPSSLLLLAAALFAVVTGANDGASLIATNLSSKTMRPLYALIALTGAVVVGPLVLGTAVATTFARGLVSFTSAGGETALLLAVLTAVSLLFILSRLGFPTSVTQALTGAIIGIGIGRGLPVDYSVVVRVIAILIAAPIAAAGLALIVAPLLERTRPRHSMRSHLEHLHAASFSSQCIAYAANDSQKMIAIFAIALATVTTEVETSLGIQFVIGVLFFVGALIGVSRLGTRVSKLLPVRPLGAISAGFSSATAVLVSASFGAPVSMAQASQSALVASESILVSYRRVRLNQAALIASVWLITLPCAVILAILVGVISRSVLP